MAPSKVYIKWKRELAKHIYIFSVDQSNAGRASQPDEQNIQHRLTLGNLCLWFRSIIHCWINDEYDFLFVQGYVILLWEIEASTYSRQFRRLRSPIDHVDGIRRVMWTRSLTSLFSRSRPGFGASVIAWIIHIYVVIYLYKRGRSLQKIYKFDEFKVCTAGVHIIEKGRRS
jgi:hypothetical protein